MVTQMKNILNREDLLGTALNIDLKVKELYKRGIRREEDMIEWVCDELEINKNSNVIQEFIHMSFVEVTRTIDW